MSEQELRALLLSALAELAPEVDLESLDPAADLTDQVDLDSMDLLNLVIALNERTGIEIPERDYPKLRSIDATVAYLLSAQRSSGEAEAQG